MKFGCSGDIGASPERVWAVVSRFEDWPRWVASLKSVEQLTPGPLRSGCEFCIRVRSIPPVSLRMTITEYRPGESVILEGRILGTRLVRYYSLERMGNRTKLIAGGDAHGPLAWLVCRVGQRLNRQIVQGIKTWVETTRDTQGT